MARGAAHLDISADSSRGTHTNFDLRARGRQPSLIWLLERHNQVWLALMEGLDDCPGYNAHTNTQYILIYISRPKHWWFFSNNTLKLFEGRWHWAHLKKLLLVTLTLKLGRVWTCIELGHRARKLHSIDCKAPTVVLFILLFWTFKPRGLWLLWDGRMFVQEKSF